MRDLQAPYTRARDETAAAGRAVIWWLICFLALCAALVVTTWHLTRASRAVGYALLLTALPALAVGVFAPLLMIKATLYIGPLPVLLQFESKSIAGSISALFGRGQFILLVFFGSAGAGHTAAEIEPGTWFFLS